MSLLTGKFNCCSAVIVFERSIHAERPFFIKRFHNLYILLYQLDYFTYTMTNNKFIFILAIARLMRRALHVHMYSISLHCSSPLS